MLSGGPHHRSPRADGSRRGRRAGEDAVGCEAVAVFVRRQVRDRPPRAISDCSSGPRAGAASIAAEGEVGKALAAAQRIGLGYALRTARTRSTALVAEAVELEQRLVGAQTASARMTVGEMLAAIPHLDENEQAAALRAAGGVGGRMLLGHLGRESLTRLVHALRDLASR